MRSLQQIVSDENTKKAIIADSVVLLDSEVAKKKGLSGIALKTGFKVIKGIKPGFVEKALENLMPDFILALEPMHREGNEGNLRFDTRLNNDPKRVASLLLSVTDEKAKNAKNALVKNTYQKLRPSAQKHVQEAVPGLAQMIQKYLNK